MSQLKRKNHCRQRRAHSAAHHRGHADDGPHSRITDWNESRLESSERATHNQERREHSARCSRTEGDRPDERFAYEEPYERASDDVAAQQAMNSVIAHAQHARLNKTANSDE